MAAFLTSQSQWAEESLPPEIDLNGIIAEEDTLSHFGINNWSVLWCRSPLEAPYVYSLLWLHSGSSSAWCDEQKQNAKTFKYTWN